MTIDISTLKYDLRLLVSFLIVELHHAVVFWIVMIDKNKPLTFGQLELKRALTHRINPAAVVKPDGDFVMVCGSQNEQCLALLNLYADLLSLDGFASFSNLLLPKTTERALVELSVDLEKAEAAGLRDHMAKTSRQSPSI